MEDRTKGRVSAIIVFFILLFVFAKWGPAINFNTTSQSKGDPLIVSGDGKVYVAPDIAKISVGVEEAGTSLALVEKSVNTKTQTLTDAIKKLGVDEKDIKTTYYSLYPQYDYSNSPNRITGYRISTTYEITVRDVDKINEIISSATSSGANMTGSVSFDLSDELKKEKLSEAREQAVSEAREKAEGLSKAAGISLGKIINISENQTGSPIVRPMYATDTVSLEKAGGGAAIESGQTTVEVTVSLSYEIR